MMTAPQEENRDAQRERIHVSIVSKSLRAQAIKLARSIPDSDRRMHAINFVRHSCRTRPDIETFIEKMEAAK